MSFQFDDGEVHDDVDQPYPPLHEAARNGDVDLIRSLVENNSGVGVNEEDWTGMVPLFHAVESGVVDAVRVLLDAGADPNGAGSLMSPITNSARRNNLCIMRLLIQRGANPDHADFADESTPVLFAAFHGNYEMVKYLIGLKVRLNVPECDGHTALSYAEERGHHEIAQLLRAARAEEPSTDTHRHP